MLGALAEERARTPKPVTPADGRDPRALPLAPMDAFVLSRVDGILDDEELSIVTGLAPDGLRTILARLESMGLITFGATPSPSPSQSARAAQPATDPKSAPRAKNAAAAPRPNAVYDPAELDEDVELEMPMRERVLDLYYRLGTLDHYGVLGIAASADKKAVKRAYFEYASAFHPDKYFRKRLGSYKQKMEAIFGRATQAHDVLANKVRRAEYDGYLLDQLRARGIEDLLKDALSEMAVAEEAVRQAVPELALLTKLVVTPPAASASASPAPLKPAVLSEAPSVDVQTRRDSLARRLLGSRAPPRPSSPGITKETTTAPHASTADAMEALRRRYDERVQTARGFQAKKYTDNAAASLAQNDPVAAANALRVALSMTPNDETLKLRYDEAQSAANAILAETYSRQAGYEEKSEQWVDAARSWCKVANARPDEAHAHERAAHAIVKANGDLHEAARLAQRACALVPTSTKNKITLANVYIAAGLMLNAKRELELAAQLSPQDDTIQALLKRVAKGVTQ
jgi:curved DNA-binding protein CbpA